MAKLELGSVILGGNVFGWTVDRAEAFRLLDAFVDGGGAAIDTADAYPSWVPGRHGGESEQLIGEWLAQPGNRQKVAIATKVAKWREQPGLAPVNIRAAFEGSLRRLQTDYIDLYYAHEDDEHVPQSEYLEALDALVREGKVRALGASNFSAPRLVSALEFTRRNGLSGFEYSQDHYNLVERDLERSLLPTLRQEGIVELPYWALAKGFLTGKYRPGVAVDSSRAESASAYLSRARNLKLLQALDAIAAEHRASVGAVALAWLRAQEGVGAPIASARTPDQLAPLLEAGKLSLTSRELDTLSAITALEN